MRRALCSYSRTRRPQIVQPGIYSSSVFLCLLKIYFHELQWKIITRRTAKSARTCTFENLWKCCCSEACHDFVPWPLYIPLKRKRIQGLNIQDTVLREIIYTCIHTHKCMFEHEKTLLPWTLVSIAGRYRCCSLR